MTKIPRFYIAVIVLAAAGLTLLLPWADLLHLSRRDLIGVIGFGLLAVFAQVFAIDLEREPRGKIDSSVAFLPLLASVLLFPPPIAVTMVAIVEFSTQLIKKRSWWIGFFNIGQGVLAVGFAALTYGVVASNGQTTGPQFFAFFAAVTVLSLTNIFLISGALASMERKGFFEMFNRAMGPGGANILYYYLASPIALIAAVLYAHLYIWGVLIFLLPLLLVRYSYLSKLQLQAANTDLLRVLVKAIETRDPYTSGHSLRVAGLAKRIAKELGLPHRRVEQIETAALLHDIGKIEESYAAMIRKAASLSEEERTIIRTHAVAGADLLKTLSLVHREVIDGVRHHHERFDGTGYPDGLAGVRIPLAARIVMLCDSVDAMLSSRPYRNALTIAEVENEIARCAGTQFDPALVHCLREKKILHDAAAVVDFQQRQASSASEIFDANRVAAAARAPLTRAL